MAAAMTRLDRSLFDRQTAESAAECARKFAAEILSPEQIAAWNRRRPRYRRSFPVVGSAGTLFHVCDYPHTNICLGQPDAYWPRGEARGGGEAARFYCVSWVVPPVAPSRMPPRWDLYVAQKLLLEHDEDLFWKIAVRW